MQSESKGVAQMNRSLTWVLGLTSLSFFMVVLDSLVVITALPRMQEDLHVGLPTLQWTVNAYGIAFAAGIITAAALGDRFGRRLVFVFGLALFTVSSAACALAPDASLLIVARTVQGIGGAAVLPLSLTILTNAFPVERRGAIVGIYGGLAGLAVASGPIIGGALTQGIDWHWIFWANVPLGVVAVLLALRLLPESHGAPARLDLPGVGLVSAGIVSLVWGLVRANDAGWASAEVVVTLAAGAALVASFLLWESRTEEPMLPLPLLRIRAFAAGNATALLMTGAIFGGAFMVTQYFQFALGYSPLATGVRLLPFTMTPIVIAPLAGAVSDRIGRRPLIVAGLVLQAVGFAWVALIASAQVSLLEILFALFLAGAGISMALPTVPTAVLNAVSPTDMGKASGINNMMQRFGAVFAVAIGTSIFSAYGHLGSAAAVSDGVRPAIAVSALLSLLGALSALLLKARPAVAGDLETAAAGIAA
jgi:EmrB/QacA subfamily drug resistance transporter